MKRTFLIDQWSCWDLLGGHDHCTVEQLIGFLQQQYEAAQQTSMENIRLECLYNDYDERDTIGLVGDREETAEEQQQREEVATRMERRALLNYIAEQHRPKLRGEHPDVWNRDCAALIQQKGWDKLSLEELRRLAVGLA